MMKPGCCKNEVKYFKVKSDHSKSSKVPFNFSWSYLLPQRYNFNALFTFSDFLNLSLDKPPPDLSQEPLYKRNSFYLI